MGRGTTLTLLAGLPEASEVPIHACVRVPWRGRNIGNRRAREREGGPWRPARFLSGQKARKIGAETGKHGKVDVKMHRGADSPKGSRVVRKGNDLPARKWPNGATWLSWASRPAVTSPARGCPDDFTETVPRCTPCTPCSAHGIVKSRRENCAELKMAESYVSYCFGPPGYCLFGSSFAAIFAACRRRCHWKRNLRQPGMTFLVRILSLPAASREPAEAGRPCVIEGPPRRCCRLARYQYERLPDGIYSMPGTVCAVPSNQTASDRGTS